MFSKQMPSESIVLPSDSYEGTSNNLGSYEGDGIDREVELAKQFGFNT
jgi:hypothetical protein